jgi:hypothetical protein
MLFPFYGLSFLWSYPDVKINIYVHVSDFTIWRNLRDLDLETLDKKFGEKQVIYKKKKV